MSMGLSVIPLAEITKFLTQMTEFLSEMQAITVCACAVGNSVEVFGAWSVSCQINVKKEGVREVTDTLFSMLLGLNYSSKSCSPISYFEASTEGK